MFVSNASLIINAPLVKRHLIWSTMIPSYRNAGINCINCTDEWRHDELQHPAICGYRKAGSITMLQHLVLWKALKRPYRTHVQVAPLTDLSFSLKFKNRFEPLVSIFQPDRNRNWSELLQPQLKASRQFSKFSLILIIYPTALLDDVNRYSLIIEPTDKRELTHSAPSNNSLTHYGVKSFPSDTLQCRQLCKINGTKHRRLVNNTNVKHKRPRERMTVTTRWIHYSTTPQTQSSAEY